MNETPFHRDNHYVPRTYLKRFAASHERIWTYRTLVSHPQVRIWEKRFIRGAAYHSHLYTRIVAGQATDEIERWLDREFENPAEEALRKATSDARLTSTDWNRLVRFLAAQDVRTPARFTEDLQRWQKILPNLLEDTMQRSVHELEAKKASGEDVTLEETPTTEHLPFRVTTEIEPGQKFGRVKGEIIAGRGLWLFGIRHLLTKTLNVLHQHKWTILKPPENLCLFTSDNPVIRLNFYGNGQYDFKGGWANPGTEILLPLGPHHLFYTQVGQRPPSRGEIMPLAQAEMIRRFIAEHADRTIFATSPDAEIPQLRPRIVNADLLREESEQRRRWHEDQTAAERKLMGWDKA